MNHVLRPVLRLAMILCFSMPVLGFGAQQATPATPPNVIEVTAKKYEFTPRVITVKQGDHVKLVITATDHDHGFALAQFGIEARLPKGVPTTVEFTADKAGSFPFKCSVMCGIGHGRMKGTLVVQPAAGNAPPPTP